jgi:hypothetical protein
MLQQETLLFSVAGGAAAGVLLRDGEAGSRGSKAGQQKAVDPVQKLLLNLDC